MQEEPTITDEYVLFGSTGVAIIHGKSTTDSSNEAYFSRKRLNNFSDKN